jgi:hypothetical protein
LPENRAPAFSKVGVGHGAGRRVGATMFRRTLGAAKSSVRLKPDPQRPTRNAGNAVGRTSVRRTARG